MTSRKARQMDPEQIAKEAIVEAWHILSLLADTDHNPAWCQDSRPQDKLDRLAQRLGYKTAKELTEEEYWKHGDS